MERVPGRVIGSELEGLSIKGFGQALSLLAQLPRIRREVLRFWDEAQTRLHALPIKDFVDLVASAGVPPENLTFASSFAGQRASVEEFGLSGLRPAVDWLTANTPRQSTPVVCHGDFHPSNVLVDNGRLTGVIDWVKATIAEPAFDYGAVMAIMATVPIRVPAGADRILRALMNNLARTHSRQCGTTPETEAALRYYQVFNCLVQLVTVGKSRAQGNLTQGAYNSPVGVANLVNHVNLLTGLTVSLPV
jgi:aminoglycoside phosphotransferase (APT) family kinase protein